MKDAWNVSFFAHLPGVSLEGVESFPIGLGELVHLSFDEWQELDGKFPYNDRQYKKSRPIFYTGHATLPADQDETFHQVSAWVNQLYQSFLMAPTVPFLPVPQLSVIYLKIEMPRDPTLQSLRFALVGPFEREWIVFGGKIRFTFTSEHLLEIQRAYRLLSTVSPESAFRGVEAGLNTLELTARPEFWWEEDGDLNYINGFIHCMTALENILLEWEEDGAKHGNLTRTFGQHATAFTTPSRDDFGNREADFANLYRLRSRLIHGQISVENLDEAGWERLLMARPLLRSVLLLAIALGRTEHEDESLPSLLSTAYQDADAHQILFKRLTEGYQI